MDSQKSFFGTPKKAFIFIVCVLAVLSAFIIGTTFAVTRIIKSSTDKSENTVENDIPNNWEIEAPEGELNPQSPLIGEDSTVVIEEGSNISIDEAKAMAASHAGFSIEEVSFSKAKLEKEHGVALYEIEFYKDGVEYEYEIDAGTSEIIKYETDRDD